MYNLLLNDCNFKLHKLVVYKKQVLKSAILSFSRGDHPEQKG